MLIISKTKDYYDRLQKQGVDKSIVFNRKIEISNNNLKHQLIVDLFSVLNQFYVKDEHNNDCYNFSIIIVCGVPYLINNFNNIALSEQEANKILNDEQSVIPFFYKNRIQRLKTNLYRFNQELYNLCKELDTPILKIEVVYYHGVVISKDVPLLADYKFQRVLSVEQVFQNIEQFIISKKSCEPPVGISDKEKIRKAGFDIKQSFRHRK